MRLSLQRDTRQIVNVKLDAEGGRVFGNDREVRIAAPKPLVFPLGGVAGERVVEVERDAHAGSLRVVLKS